eukprot:TRINITY_DN6209_c0_g1_i1.p1 TRINITY_DN6209_c0_g1~~TRINITY_DN6209_c0_g1_i1.p1  ORF type:complete len:1010 (+),score=252.90 TRINITY_DN6209_c0_g1_i1:137-3166(+)
MLALSGLFIVLIAWPSVAAPDDPFQRWLHNLTIPIPNSAPINTSSEIFLIEGGICGNATIDDLSSSQSALTYWLSLGQIDLDCHMRLYFGFRKDYKQPKIPLVNQTVKVSVSRLSSDQPAVELTLSLGKGQDGLAHSASGNVTLGLDVDVEIPGHSVEQKILKIIVPAIRQTLETEIQDAVNKLIDVNLTAALQKLDKQLANVTRGKPRPAAVPIDNEHINLMTSPIIELVDFFVDKLIGPDLINKLIDDVTAGTGKLSVDIDITLPFAIPALGNITLSVDQVAVGGLDTWRQFTLFNASAPSRLDTRTDLEGLDIVVAMGINVSLAGQSLQLYEGFNLTFTMANGSLDLDVDLLVSTARSNALQAAQSLNAQCLLSTVDYIAMPWFHLNFTVQDLSLAADGGISERDLDQAINDFVALLVGGFDPVIPFLLDAVLDDLAQDVTKLLNQTVANASCPAPGPVKKQYDVTANTIATWIGSSLAVTFTLALALYLRRAFKHGSNASSPFSSADSMPLLAQEAVAPCLAAEKSVPSYARYGIPLLILGSIAVLMYSNTAAGASVYPAIYIKGNRFKYQSLFTFSLVNTIRDMFHADAIPLALVVGVFSGAWPYLKLILMLFAWVCPVSLLKERRRETLLRVLDALGKWSLIDTYVLVMMLVAFRFHLPLLPEAVEAQHGMTSLDIFVGPDDGFHTFVIVTVVSLILSHVLLHFHRAAADHHIHPEPSEEKRAFGGHVFKGSSGDYQFTYFGYGTILLVLLGSIGLIIAGAMAPAFSFDFKGLAAGALMFEKEVMGYNDEAVHRNYSLIDVGESIATSYEFPDKFAIRYVQVVFFLFALVVPLAHMLVMGFVWAYPMLPKHQRVAFIAAETLNAWSGMDVFVVSIFAAILQIEKFAQFIIGSNCDAINGIIQDLIDQGYLPPDMEPKCFDVIATLDNGCWLLFGAMLSSFVAAFIVMPICHQALQERMHQTKYKRLHTVQSMGELDRPKPGCCHSLRIAAHLGLVKHVDGQRV